MERNSDLERQKEESIERLAAAYARDQISMERYEELTELIQAAPDLSTLNATLRSLPVTVDGGAFDQGPSPVVDPGEKIVTILGERKIRGAWLTGRNATSMTILGSTTLDLRDVDLSRHPRIHVVSLMGEVTIRVPADARVNSTVTPILAEVSDRGRPSNQYGPSEITLTGVAVMSEVKIRYE